jgi:hypothetical protein
MLQPIFDASVAPVYLATDPDLRGGTGLAMTELTAPKKYYLQCVDEHSQV